MAKNILIVDDQHEVRRVLRSGLESLGLKYKVMDTPSAEEAMLILFRQKVDLLVLDFRLPGITGLEFMEKVRRRNPDVKVIMITGVQDRQIKRQLAEAGASAFFFKPVNMNEFLEAVEKALAESGEAKQAPTPAQAGAPEAISEEQAPELAERAFDLDGCLKELLDETKALAAALIKDTGAVLGYSGKLPLAAEKEFVRKQLAGLVQSAAALWPALGAESESSFLALHNPTLTVFAAAVDPHSMLCIFAESGQLVSWAKPLPRFVREIREGLAEQCQNQPAAVAAETEEPAKEGALDLDFDVEVSEEDRQQMEALFQAAPNMKNAGDLDSFWESVTEGNELDGNIKDNALSYEEAMRLGLTPDEG